MQTQHDTTQADAQQQAEEAQHSAEPWTLHEYKDGTLEITQYGGMAIGFIEWGKHVGKSERKANARLIVSAPETVRKLAQSQATCAELLAALRTAADWLARSERIDDREQADDARAAMQAGQRM